MSSLSVVVKADGVVREFSGTGDGPELVAAFRAWLAGPHLALPMAEGADEVDVAAGEVAAEADSLLSDSGGLNAGQQALVEQHIEWANSGAMLHYRRFGGSHDLDDLRSAAYYGLVIAARKFDPSRGFTFKTYAMNWTEWALRRVHQESKRARGWVWDSRVETGMKQRANVVAWPTNEDGEQIDIGHDAPDHDSELESEQQRQMVRALAKGDGERKVVDGLFAGFNCREIAEREGFSTQRAWQLRKSVIVRSKRLAG
jgi:RNA polymerase sigma factor (sigma-70 family)